MTSSHANGPLLHTRIDHGTLELTKLVGYDNDSITYRAAGPTSGALYDVKCYTRSPSGLGIDSSASTVVSAHRRATNEFDVRREYTLHRYVSDHPNVVTVHRLVDEAPNLFLVLDRNEPLNGESLLTHIQKSQHLDRSALIKKAFLQLLDAVEYCHSLGVFHRNLRPDAIVCLDSGQLAITDFGLATIAKTSEECFVGSGWYMAPGESVDFVQRRDGDVY